MKNPFLIILMVGICWGSFSIDTAAGSSKKPSTTVASMPSPAVGQEEPNVKIIADSLECDQIKNVCVALGSAIIEKLNDPDKKTIRADQIEMFFEKANDISPEQNQKNKMAGGQKAKEFHADGHVIVTLKDTIIRGDRAIYNPNTDVAEVFENVSVTSGRNEVIGNYGRADLKTGEYKVLNSDGRVTALVFQQQENNKSK